MSSIPSSSTCVTSSLILVSTSGFSSSPLSSPCVTFSSCWSLSSTCVVFSSCWLLSSTCVVFSSCWSLSSTCVVFSSCWSLSSTCVVFSSCWSLSSICTTCSLPLSSIRLSISVAPDVMPVPKTLIEAIIANTFLIFLFIVHFSFCYFFVAFTISYITVLSY